MKYILFLLFLVSNSFNVVHANMFDDITNAAKNIIGDATGDWCSGKKYFSDMEYSQRLQDGKEDLSNKMGKLLDSSNKMEYDIKFYITRGASRARDNSKNLVDLNNKLCKEAKENNYTSTDYNGTPLRDKNEIFAQARMNLATIRSSNKVTEFYNKQEIEFDSLNKRIKNKANELAVLKKNFDNLSDPRSKNKSLSYVESVIGNACAAIVEGEDLIMKYSEKNSSQLFRNVARKNQTSTISESDVSSFMNNCGGSDEKQQQSLFDKARLLFGLNDK